MREIKFRAWDEAMGKMIYPVGMIYESGKVIGVSEDIYGFSASLDHPNREGSDYGILYLNAGFVLMQYTGLKDSEGNDIYEGDVIRESHHIGDYEHDIFNCVVVYERGSFIFDFCQLNNGRLGKYTMYDRESDDYRRHIVIGNLYQNPELLNEPQNENI